MLREHDTEKNASKTLKNTLCSFVSKRMHSSSVQKRSNLFDNFVGQT